MLLLQWSLSSLGFCSVSSDNFFFFRHTHLPLVLTIDFCNSQLIFFFVYILFKKDTKIKGVPLLHFEGGPGILYLNFEGGPEVPLLNFRGVPGLTFKL